MEKDTLAVALGIVRGPEGEFHSRMHPSEHSRVSKARGEALVY